jgi:hypothetical protein
MAALVLDPDVQRFTRVPFSPPPSFPQAWLARYRAGRADGTREAFAVEDRCDGSFLGIAVAPSIDPEARTVELGAHAVALDRELPGDVFPKLCCDVVNRGLAIYQGKIIALDTPEGLKRRIDQKEVIRLELTGWHEDIAGKLKSISGVENIITRQQGEADLWEVSLQAQNSRAALPRIVEHIGGNGTRLVNMNIVKPSLEDVFIHLTGKALRD